MKIGFEAKRIFHNDTGLGNYGRDTVRILNEHASIIDHFFLFNTRKSNLKKPVPLERATVLYPHKWFWKMFPSVWRMLGQNYQIKSLHLNCYHGLSGEIPVQIKKNPVPKIVTIHDLIFLSHPNYYSFFDRIVYKFKFKYATKTADHIIAISEHTKSDIVKFLNANPNKISVIYQGCGQIFKKRYPENEKRQMRRKYNLPEEFIINVGTLQERKNALTLIKAIKGTKRHLVLVGKEKKYARKLYRYVAKHKLKDQVSFLKNVGIKDLALLYQSATIFCYPSLCEGFGIPIIEAMYSKIPVVVTKGGCFPEAAGPDAVYIDPNDPHEIRNQLEELFKNPQKRASMVKKAYGYVQRFSDENVAKNLLGLYKSLL